jgi:ATP-binding cassette subfamily B protein RaxB
MVDMSTLRPLLRMSGAPVVPIIRQSALTECGLACVAMIANFLGSGIDMARLRRGHRVSMKGSMLTDITRICDDLHLSTRAVTCDVVELDQLRAPCILHWGFNHFVVLVSVGRKHIVIHDPARGVVKESFATASDSFTGVALEVSRGSGFRPARQPLQLKLSSLVTMRGDIVYKFSAGLMLALVCEVLVLAAPFYLQVVIDEVLPSGDWLLLNTLVVGFTALLLFQIIANAMRQLTFQYLGQVTVFDITARVLHRLLRLPLTYFRSRELGDVQHRIQSLSRIQDFVVQSAPALLLDVVFAILVTGLMAVYEPDVIILIVAAALAWCLWRVSIFTISLRLANDIAQAESSVQTHFLETLRATQSIKLANGEAVRESEWRNLFASAINARIRAGNLGILDSALRLALFQGVRIAVIYMLAVRGIDGRISIGMIAAFIAYLGMFNIRVGGIIDRIFEYKLLEVPLSRLADIVFTDTEPLGRRGAVGTNSPGTVEMRNVAFIYDGNGSPVLRNCTCRVPEGGLTVIAGRSGSGKSTLLRLIAGVEQLTSGELLVGGRAIRDWHVHELRAQVATVFQDDCLLKGSVADNIALFAADKDLQRIRSAARDACIAAEIESMPMAYETRIGDLGSSLSKGQMQRILIARALYRRPKLLLLDEATSGLDIVTEKRVVDSIVRLDATRIVVTHSDLMMQAAHDVLWLSNGTLLSSRPELNV